MFEEKLLDGITAYLLASLLWQKLSTWLQDHCLAWRPLETLDRQSGNEASELPVEGEGAGIRDVIDCYMRRERVRKAIELGYEYFSKKKQCIPCGP